jgi:hypothetical protein
VIVGRDQADFIRYRLGNEAFQSLRIGGFDHAGDHVAAPLDWVDIVLLGMCP